MIRPLEPADADALHALLVEPAVARATRGTPFDGTAHTARRATAPWRFGAFEGGKLVAAAFVTPGGRPRTARTASLGLAGFHGGLLDHVLDTADRWLGLVRVEVNLPATDPLVPRLLTRGFEREVLRRDADVDGDLVSLGRVLPGFSCPPPTSPPAWPERGARAEVRLRGSEPGDAYAFAQIHQEPTVRWGTLQDPTQTAAQWHATLAGNNRPGHNGFVAEVDGQIVGSAAVFVRSSPHGHVGLIGMSVATAWQGRGVGAQILQGCVTLGFDWLGLRRLELEVWPDNVRARSLYARHGFKEEGARRLAAIRDGTFVDALVMACLRARR